MAYAGVVGGTPDFVLPGIMAVDHLRSDGTSDSFPVVMPVPQRAAMRAARPAHPPRYRHVSLEATPVPPHIDDASATDAVLMARMAMGDDRALGMLYDRWHGRVRALAHRMLQDHASSEEVVEDVFWQAWREAVRFDAARGDLAAWLMTITRTRCLDRLRAERRRPIGSGAQWEAVTEIASADDPIAALEVAERAGRVRAALATLPEDQREVLDLAYYGGLSQSEIATRIGAPIGTIKGRIRLAMQKLRLCLRGMEVDR